VIGWFRERGELLVDTVMVVDEDVEFAMPSVLARKLRELSGQPLDEADELAASSELSSDPADDPLSVDLPR